MVGVLSTIGIWICLQNNFMGNKSSNKNLHKASLAKKDEFYTQLIDIENELKHYKEQFKNKIVYCNCDDPFESNFFKYTSRGLGCPSMALYNTGWVNLGSSPSL